ncbi:hypothetical protein EGW08_006891, partial [Elysia chlorotica]
DPKKVDLTEKKTASGDSSPAGKDKLIRPGQTDKLIRPAKSNSGSSKSAGKSSALSRLLSTRRSKDAQTSASPTTPPISNNSVKAAPALPKIKESFTGEPVKGEQEEEGEASVKKVKDSPSNNNPSEDPSPLLIDFDTEETSPGENLFDPLVAAVTSSTPASSTEQKFADPWQAPSSLDNKAQDFSSLDIFSSLDLNNAQKSAAASETSLEGSDNARPVVGRTA